MVDNGLWIGTSGWNYAHWAGCFYAGVPRRDWLRHYCRCFNAVEVNATFYRLLDRRTFERWRDETPDGFRFALKGNRFVTHRKRLRDPVDAVCVERERALGLGPKLAAVIWQLPATLPKQVDRLQAFAEALGRWTEARHAVEFRHPGWFDAQVADCLRSYSIANCQSDAADWPLWDARTTDMVYLRLHGHTRTYASAYRTKTLEKWAGRIQGWLDSGVSVHVYFDNDAEGAAPRDARRLARMMGLGSG